MPMIGNPIVFTVLDTFRRTDSLSWFRYLRSESDEKNWSSRFLRDQFKEKGLEHLFDKYRSRIQQSTFTLALMITIAFSIARLVTIFTVAEIGETTDYSPTSIIYGCVIFISFALLVFVCLHTVNWKWELMHYFMSLIVLFVLLLADYIFIIYNWEPSHSPRLSPTFIVILIIYIFLPFPHYYGATIAGCGVTLLELFISGFIFYSEISEEYGEPYRLFPIIADCVFLIACNAFGVYKLYIDEVNQRRAFLDRRACIESQIKCVLEEKREDNLLSTVLPRHIIHDVKRDIRSGILNSDMKPNNHWPFSELYVGKYENVSIMFADIVNFTKLASNLTSKSLVIFLDELFGDFDKIAEKHECARIRIVGDCYIATCGLPDYISNHAVNCVEMGFEMIQTIKKHREDKKMNIDMRIGIHCGNVISGILGVRKWQFDIWSQDVEIANLMEHTGQSGRIHVSNIVKNLLGNIYEYEPGFGETKSQILEEKGISTYLIIPKAETNYYEDNFKIENVNYNGKKRVSIYQPNIPRIKRSATSYKRLSSVLMIERNGIKSAQEENALQSREPMSETVTDSVNIQMEKAIDRMALRKKDQWTKDTGIDPLTLRFASIELEMPFMRQLDPLYKYYLLAVLIIFVTLFGISSLAIMTADPLTSIPYVILILPLVGLVYSAWHDYIINVKLDSCEGTNIPRTPKGRLNSFLTTFSRNVASSFRMRLVLWVVSISLLTMMVIVSMSMCLFHDRMDCKYNSEEKIENPRYFTYSFALAITSVAVFLRIQHLIKLIAYIVILTIYFILIGVHDNDFHFETFLPGQFARSDYFPVDHGVYIFFIILCHHLMDRQFEYLSRLDYLWKCQLRQKQEETNITNTVNKFLIQNILPQHVAVFYMNDGTKDMIYHEEYTHVAVMFASIPNFSDFYEETDINGHGLKCLQLLNEIVCELDCLLNVPEFSRIEKIKVIGSTYMAAAGLKPSRRSSAAEDNENLEPLAVETNVITLVDMAFEMIEILDRLNRNALQEFQFRIGIEYGCVSAGVVGAKKPLYDIWGDTVNVASRMESTGITGRIQVTEKVAKVLLAAGYSCDCRGNIYIKGKDRGLVTYLLNFRPSQSTTSDVNSDTDLESVCESTDL